VRYIGQDCCQNARTDEYDILPKSLFQYSAPTCWTEAEDDAILAQSQAEPDHRPRGLRMSIASSPRPAVKFDAARRWHESTSPGSSRLTIQ
jgi:hypothetical protein